LTELTIEELLDKGLHDSVLKFLSLDFVGRKIELQILLSRTNEVTITLCGVLSIVGINFKRFNKIVILDYNFTRNSIKIFTTLLEWIEIRFDSIYIKSRSVN
jgi:hypothetical protein